MKIYNAKINSTMLGYEDHGILTIMLHLSFENSGQGFGGYNLSPEADPTSLSKFIQKTLDVVGVDKWEKLPGSFARVKEDNGRLIAIGNLMDDQWFEPQKDLA